MKTQQNTTNKLDDFTKAYIECALWSSIDSEGNPLDSNYNESDISSETLKRMIEDCAKFQKENGLPEYSQMTYSDAELAGHDFWLTRNHHGAGFWDGDIEDKNIAVKYTKAAHAFGECDLYVGDNGKLYS